MERTPAACRSPATPLPLAGARRPDLVERVLVIGKHPTLGDLPSAIFAANDPAAIGALNAASEAGVKVPDDVALVGGGNIHYGDMLRVPLTTVAWSTIEMGQAAANLLIEMIEGKDKKRRNQQIIVEPELVVRESCGATKAILV